MPREIVHQILDDLPLFQVLQLISCQENSAYIDQCVLSHPWYQKIFDSQQALNTTRDLFIIFYGLHTSLRLAQASKKWLRAYKIKPFPSNKKDLKEYLRTATCNIMKSIPDGHLNALREVSNGSLLSSSKQFEHPLIGLYTKTLYHQWQWTEAAQHMFNGMRSAQLNKMANIFETFPDLLKTSMDPSQKPRSNTEHIPARFRQCARRADREHWMKKTSNGSNRYFNCHLFPLIPFDACLRLFIRTVHENPQYTEDSGQAARTDQDKTSFPPGILKDIKTAIAGMDYVYTTRKPGNEADTRPTVLRTKFTPYSAAACQRAYASTSPQTDAVGSPSTPATQMTMERGTHWQLRDHDTAGMWPTIPTNHARPHRVRKRNIQFQNAMKEHACPDDCWDPGHKHPVFTTPPCGHLGRLLVNKFVNEAWMGCERVVGYCEEEVEWLLAFLRAVRFMKGWEGMKGWE
ncbi:MAG: hypothetical protein Q9218_003702 [Villophora microphyllina]